MLHAYIDESGDEGTGERSSPWLVLGSIVIQERDIPGVKQYLKAGIEGVWKGQTVPEHVHFYKIGTHSQKKALLYMLKGLNFTSCTVAAKKLAFSASVLTALKPPYMYNYVAKHLLERLSWFARDSGQKVRVTFASRNEASWTEFEEYIEKLRSRNDHQIKFDFIDSIGTIPSNRNSIVQAADWLSSACGCGLNPDGFGNVETCYTEILWGKFWIRGGKLWPYGIKVLPHNYVRQESVLFKKIDTWLEDPTTLIT